MHMHTVHYYLGMKHTVRLHWPISAEIRFENFVIFVTGMGETLFLPIFDQHLFSSNIIDTCIPSETPLDFLILNYFSFKKC